MTGSVNDWATKAAAYIDSSYGARGTNPQSVDRIAAVIATFAEPLVKLLREAKREHSYGYNDECCDYSPCPKVDDEDATCNCRADEWNARVDKVLEGR